MKLFILVLLASVPALAADSCDDTSLAEQVIARQILVKGFLKHPLRRDLRYALEGSGDDPRFVQFGAMDCDAILAERERCTITLKVTGAPDEVIDATVHQGTVTDASVDSGQ